MVSFRSKMEEGISQNVGQYALGSTVMRKSVDDQSSYAHYSMPGILHFVQTEWARFEMERAQWDVERAELQARIAFLQGERKGQENLKQDLVRRIKMLEFALKQERVKYHKLKFGTELSPDTKPNFEKEEKDSLNEEMMMNQQNTNVTWKQGRQLLRQYLQEIGYTDTIIDVRSARVRQLLGIQGRDDQDRPVVNGDVSVKGQLAGNQGGRAPSSKISSVVDHVLNETEKSVIATFDFLNDDEDEENLSDGEIDDDDDDDDDDDEERETRRKGPKPIGNESMAGIDEIADSEAAMSDFDFLVSEGNEGAGEAKSGETSTEDWDVDKQLISKLTEQYKKERGKGKKGMQRPKRSDLKVMLDTLGSDAHDVTDQTQHRVENNSVANEEDSGNNILGGIPGNEDDALEAALGLGELAGLTISNDAENNYVLNGADMNSTKEAFRKTWNAKYTLRSHFDSVRALAFHPVEPVLITASEDHTLKLWNLQKTVPAKKTVSLDVEPVYTFRGHNGPVLCLAVDPTGEMCYSGGMDSTIRCWNIPSSNIDPYDAFDQSVLQDTLVAHTDTVWGLSIHSAKMQLLSCSADGTVRLWEPGSKTPLLNTFRVEEESGIPTSVDFIRCEPSQMVAAYTTSNAYVYDIETSQKILLLESQTQDIHITSQINQIISHPTLPVTITAHNDRQIRFFDNNSGKMIHSMVAHLDAVTSLAIDPNGLYLLSGSHDCSIRLWNLDTRTCVQEITSHRKKFEESIHGVAFHPTKPFIASAGADALAKVFV